MIALYCVGSTTASFEVGTAQHYFVVYKPRKNFALLHFYLVGMRTFTFSFSPSWCLGVVLSQGMAISHYASVTLDYNLCCAKCWQFVEGGDEQEEGGPTMSSLSVTERWLHGWIYSWTLRQCKSILVAITWLVLTHRVFYPVFFPPRLSCFFGVWFFCLVFLGVFLRVEGRGNGMLLKVKESSKMVSEQWFKKKKISYMIMSVWIFNPVPKVKTANFKLLTCLNWWLQDKWCILWCYSLWAFTKCLLLWAKILVN